MKATILCRLLEVQQETELRSLGATRVGHQKREQRGGGAAFFERRWLRNEDFRSPDEKLACDKAKGHELWLEISQDQRFSCNLCFSPTACATCETLRSSFSWKTLSTRANAKFYYCSC